MAISFVTIGIWLFGLIAYSVIGIVIATRIMPIIQKEVFKARRDSGNFMPWFEVLLGTVIACIWPIFALLAVLGAGISYIGEKQ